MEILDVDSLSAFPASRSPPRIPSAANPKLELPLLGDRPQVRVPVLVGSPAHLNAS